MPSSWRGAWPRRPSLLRPLRTEDSGVKLGFVARRRLFPRLGGLLAAVLLPVAAHAAAPDDQDSRLPDDLDASARAAVSRDSEGPALPHDQARSRQLIDRGPSVIPEMIQVIASTGDAGARLDALFVLAHFGPQSRQAVPALLAVVRRTDSLLDEFAGDPAAEPKRADAEMATRALTAIGEEAIGPLVEALGAFPWVSRALVRALAGMGPAAIPRLLDGLPARPPVLRDRIAAVLGESRPVLPEAVQALGRLLDDDPVSRVRMSAALALKQLGAEAGPAVPSLLKVLDEPGIGVYAAEALAASGREPDRAVEVLIRELRTPAPSWKQEPLVEPLRRLAAEVPEALDALIEALRASPYKTVRLASAKALGRLGPAARAAVVPLILASEEERTGSAGSDNVHDESRYALSLIGPGEPGAVADLVGLLEHRDSWVRLGAAEALGRIGPPARAALPALASRLLMEEGWGGGVGRGDRPDRRRRAGGGQGA